MRTQKTVQQSYKFNTSSEKGTRIFNMMFDDDGEFGPAFLKATVIFLRGDQRSVASVCKGWNLRLQTLLRDSARSIMSMVPFVRETVREELSFLSFYEPFTRLNLSCDGNFTVMSFTFNVYSEARELLEGKPVDVKSDLYWLIGEVGDELTSFIGPVMKVFDRDFVAMQSAGYSIQ